MMSKAVTPSTGGYEKKDALLIAIEEGRTIVKDPNAPRYSSMEDLKAALEV